MTNVTDVVRRERIAVIEGDAIVSGDPSCEMTTVLGSCVAACLYDPFGRIGGMNHFLLGEPLRPGSGTIDEHYGLYLMEVLINRMMHAGADRRRMRAHLYGGARLRDGLGDIGAQNGLFAQRFLEAEGIALVRHDLGGSSARRIAFRPYSGQIRVSTTDPRRIEPELPKQRPAAACGDIEFF